tara:strand:- start:2437 stop:2595 length:159 start_codon:yes stop_codon:yes gene_type:complete
MAKATKARGQKPHGGNESTKKIPLQTGFRVCFRVMNLQKRTICDEIISLTFA